MSEFVVIPAIDIKDGRCVRLRQGLADEVTVYGDDPLEMARQWEAEGAQRLHVVDLDGAFDGRPAHADTIGRIAQTLNIPVQTGGGLRNDDHIQTMVDRGIDRVILGTRVLAEPDALERLVERFGAHLAVGIDARGGKVQIKGWTETTDEDAIALAQRMDHAGLKTLIYTDTSRDGMLDGVNGEAMAAMSDAVSCSVIASGGVSSEEDIRVLKGLNRENLNGVIVGKALYDKRVDLGALRAI